MNPLLAFTRSLSGYFLRKKKTDHELEQQRQTAIRLRQRLRSIPYYSYQANMARLDGGRDAESQYWMELARHSSISEQGEAGSDYISHVIRNQVSARQKTDSPMQHKKPRR